MEKIETIEKMEQEAVKAIREHVVKFFQGKKIKCVYLSSIKEFFLYDDLDAEWPFIVLNSLGNGHMIYDIDAIMFENDEFSFMSYQQFDDISECVSFSRKTPIVFNDSQKDFPFEGTNEICLDNGADKTSPYVLFRNLYHLLPVIEKFMENNKEILHSMPL